MSNEAKSRLPEEVRTVSADLNQKMKELECCGGSAIDVKLESFVDELWSKMVWIFVAYLFRFYFVVVTYCSRRMTRNAC
uniref:Uncharacterized protein n=1 Tax=Syphacia muris TaxID=451379 RepID=A0A0N5AU89_9BILA